MSVPQDKLQEKELVQFVSERTKEIIGDTPFSSIKNIWFTFQSTVFSKPILDEKIQTILIKIKWSITQPFDLFIQSLHYYINKLHVILDPIGTEERKNVREFVSAVSEKLKDFPSYKPTAIQITPERKITFVQFVHRQIAIVMNTDWLWYRLDLRVSNAYSEKIQHANAVSRLFSKMEKFEDDDFDRYMALLNNALKEMEAMHKQIKTTSEAIILKSFIHAVQTEIEQIGMYPKEEVPEVKKEEPALEDKKDDRQQVFLKVDLSKRELVLDVPPFFTATMSTLFYSQHIYPLLEHCPDKSRDKISFFYYPREEIIQKVQQRIEQGLKDGEEVQNLNLIDTSNNQFHR